MICHDRLMFMWSSFFSGVYWYFTFLHWLRSRGWWGYVFWKSEHFVDFIRLWAILGKRSLLQIANPRNSYYSVLIVKRQCSPRVEWDSSIIVTMILKDKVPVGRLRNCRWEINNSTNCLPFLTVSNLSISDQRNLKLHIRNSLSVWIYSSWPIFCNKLG